MAKRIPAGPGTTTATYTTFRQGLWESFGAQTNLSFIGAIIQDREGHLWFGSRFGGVFRYDGTHLTHFTDKDGLPSGDMQFMHSILEDHQGHLWFGIGGWRDDARAGLCRYDGKEFLIFTSEDGLGTNDVLSLCEDRHGHLWVGTASGVSCYDGQHFHPLTTAEGLAPNRVTCILEDRQVTCGLAAGVAGMSQARAASAATTARNFIASKNLPLRKCCRSSRIAMEICGSALRAAAFAGMANT